jgi:hypothetical protein
MTHSYHDTKKFTNPLVEKCIKCKKRRVFHHHLLCDFCYGKNVNTYRKRKIRRLYNEKEKNKNKENHKNF